MLSARCAQAGGRACRASLAQCDNGSQSEPAAQGADATLHDTLTAADAAVRNNAAVGGVASSVNTDFLDKLSFVDDRLVATLDLGAGGSFDQILERSNSI